MLITRGACEFFDDLLWVLPMFIAPAIAVILLLFVESWQLKLLIILGLGAVPFVAFLFIARMMHQALEKKASEEFSREIHMYFLGNE